MNSTKKNIRLFVVASLSLGLYASDYSNGECLSKGHQKFTWDKLNSNDLGDKKIIYNYAGIRKFRPTPKAGVHPRIFFGPDDLADIRNNIKNTKAGKELWLNAMAWIQAMKGHYDRDADYAKPKRIWGRYRVPLFRSVGKEIENQGVMWNKLKNGEYVKPAYHWHVFPLEAFRCLIENDSESAKELINILELLVNEERKQDKEKHPYRPVGGHNLAWCYDFLYNWMSAEQQSFFRKEITRGTSYHAHYGTFLPANSSASNWTTLDSFLPITLLAIEGEEGYNEFKYKGTLRAWHNFITYGWYKSGEGYEGRGKNYQFNDTMIAFAQRGDNLVAHPHVRAYGENLLFNTVQPYGGSFISHDLWGGTGRNPEVPPGQAQWLPNIHDAIGLKWIFPNNKKIDYVYRNVVGEDYSRLPRRPDGYNNALISALIFCSDFDQVNNKPAMLDESLHFFCPERGLMASRSSWDKDALFLSMHTRQDLGGHTCADRNSITLSGAGRLWARESTHNFSSFTNSMVIIDEKEQSHTVPARVVDFAHSPDATFMTGDTTYTWSWFFSDRYNSKEKPSKVLQTPNDFRLEKGAEAYYNRPLYEKDHWLKVGETRRQMKSPNLPVEYSFRSSGIVRGEQAYALIVDDIKVDDKMHRYDWQLQLTKDLAIFKSVGNDIFLSGGHDNETTRTNKLPKKGEPVLLVRLLEIEDKKPSIEISHDVFYKTSLKQEKAQGENNKLNKTLVISQNSILGNFKVMLFPHRMGDPLPESQWLSKGKKLSVSRSEQTQLIYFEREESGKTHISIKNDGFLFFNESLLELKRPVEPMPDRDSAELARLAAIEKKEREQALRDLADFTPQSLPGLSEEYKQLNYLPKESKTAEYITLKKDLNPQSFTLSFWVKAGKNKDTVLFDNGGNRGFQLSFFQGKSLRIASDNNWYLHMSPQKIDTWCHIVTCFSNGQLRIYENGKLIAEKTYKNKPRFNQSKIYLNYHLKNVRVHDTALSEPEVIKLYKYQTYVSPSVK